MQGNDIGAFSTARQAVVWEGLLALPKPGRINEFNRKRLAKAERWDDWLALWDPAEVPLKIMIDQHNRLGITTDVYTMTNHGLVDPIENWLIRKGASCRVFFYENVHELVDDLKYNRSIHRVLCADQDMSADIGIRAMCVDTEKGWA